MPAPQTFPIKKYYTMPALTCQSNFLLKNWHGRRALSKTSQNADLCWNLPFPGFTQSRLIKISGKSFYRVSVILNNQFINKITESPKFPILKPQVVGLSEWSGRQTDAHRKVFILQPLPQFTQQGCELFTAPDHPTAVGVIWRWRAAHLLFIEGSRKCVVAELHRPSEMVIKLKTIHPTPLQGFHDQTDESSPDLRMGRVQPGHAVVAMHGHPSLAIGSSKNPLRMITNHSGVSWLHQAVLKPRHHLDSTLPAFLCNGADRIELNTGLQQRRLDRGKKTLMKRGATTPNIRDHPVETSCLKALHRQPDALLVVVQLAGTIGEPNPHRQSWFQQPLKARLSRYRRCCPTTKQQSDQSQRFQPKHVQQQHAMGKASPLHGPLVETLSSRVNRPHRKNKPKKNADAARH